MAELIYKLTIPDATVDEFVSQLGKCYGYRDTIDGKPNPQSVGDYVAQRVQQELVKKVKAQNMIEANKVATEAAAAAVETDFKAKYGAIAIVVDKTPEKKPIAIEV